MLACNNRGIITIRDAKRTIVAMEQLSKHVSAETNSCNNRTAEFSAWSVPGDYKKDKEDRANAVPGGITGPPCSWGIQIRGPRRLGWGSLESETVKYGHDFAGEGQ
jgi:hypothetical protein